MTRILNGLSIGLGYAVPAAFGHEICPNEISGRSGCTVYFQIVVGIFVAYLFGADAGVGGENSFWRALFALPIAVSLLQLLLLQKYYPWESPRWLWMNYKTEEAGEILYELYKPWVVEDVKKRFEKDAAA